MPQRHETLGSFVKRLRKEYGLQKRGLRKMDPTKIKMLDDLGFSWRVRGLRGRQHRNTSIQHQEGEGQDELQEDDDDEETEEEEEDPAQEDFITV